MTKHDDGGILNDLQLSRASLVALLRPPVAKKPAQVRQDFTLGIGWHQQLSDTLDNPRRLNEELARAEEAIAAWEADGTRFLTFQDPDYPAQLRDVYDYPLFVFARGKLLGEGVRDRGICIVGSRNANAAVQRFASDFSRAVIERGGWTVVSGLARGIDAAAHRAALDLEARTVAVIGTGVHKTFPQENEELQRRLEMDGLVISQFWPDDGANARHFPMRNAVMSAYGRATVVIYAEESSGTRHQVKQAVKHARPVIITPSVYERTSWGKALADDPNTAVRVATDQEHALALLERIASAGPHLPESIEAVFQ
ncbi:DNA-protecting protein DprA [Micrococcales bacterium 31B]|nr:DNA-protecting protein DprA [Micrococcales bacterium 31B]